MFGKRDGQPEGGRIGDSHERRSGAHDGTGHRIGEASWDVEFFYDRHD